MPGMHEDEYRRAYHRAYQDSVMNSSVILGPGETLVPLGNGAYRYEVHHTESASPMAADLLKPNLTRWEHAWLAVFMALAMGNTPPQSGANDALLCITWIVTCGWLFGRLLLWAHDRWGDAL